jgi:hypothetical protein
VAKVDLHKQEAQVEACACNRNYDNDDAVCSVNSDSQEHEEQAELETQDAGNVAVGSD